MEKDKDKVYLLNKKFALPMWEKKKRETVSKDIMIYIYSIYIGAIMFIHRSEWPMGRKCIKKGSKSPAQFVVSNACRLFTKSTMLSFSGL